MKSIFGRSIIKLVCKLHAAATGNVLHDNRGISRNMLTEVLREYAGSCVEAATGPKTNLNAQLFSLIKITVEGSVVR